MHTSETIETFKIKETEHTKPFSVNINLTGPDYACVAALMADIRLAVHGDAHRIKGKQIELGSMLRGSIADIPAYWAVIKYNDDIELSNTSKYEEISYAIGVSMFEVWRARICFTPDVRIRWGVVCHLGATYGLLPSEVLRTAKLFDVLTLHDLKVAVATGEGS